MPMPAKSSHASGPSPIGFAIAFFPSAVATGNLASLWRNPMKTLYALCLVTLLAVLLDVVFFHSRTANAQDTGNYKIEQFPGYQKSAALRGTVAGFSCVESQNQTFCYALTKQ